MYDYIPEGLALYYSHNGRHISKKLYEYLVPKMYKINKANGAKVYMQPMQREQYDTVMKRHGVTLDNDILYDGMYVYSMGMADFFGSSITDEQHLALFVKDYVDDPDQPDGFVFNRLYSDMVLKGTPIRWEEML